MLCDICGKSQATVHLTEIIDEQMTELHLCESCAKEKGAQMEKHFGLSDLLAGLADIGEAPELAKAQEQQCPACGLLFSEFKRTGRFGCAQCYEAFKDQLLPLLRRIHGSIKHAGKPTTMRPPAPVKPVRGAEAQILQLKAKLLKAVEMEEFEEAAGLRDQIKELEAKRRGKK